MGSAVTAGYSGTPLAKKLGIVAGATVAALHAPAELGDWLAPLPEGATVVERLTAGAPVTLAFVTERSHLAKAWPRLTKAAGPTGAIWVCWPKKVPPNRAAAVPTDVTEDVVRAVVLPTGWVDVKVCAVSDVWSGLKCVLRKELR
jgi:hypothetical protein